MKLVRAMGVAVLSVLFFSGVYVPSSNALDQESIPAEGITQGEFAIWLVEAAGAEGKLPPAALADDAIKFLTNLGFQPADGWNADKKLTRKELLQILGISESEAADKTWAELVEMVVDKVSAAIESAVATSGSSVTPTVSPSGSR